MKMIAGAAELHAYREHKSGIDLFRAYLARRRADVAGADTIMTRLRERLEQGLTPQLFEAVQAELVMLQILEQLDPVIADLLKVCERPPGKDEVLANLRSALRLGKGGAPTNAEAAWQRWRIEELWKQAYVAMQSTRVVRSDRSLAKEIAANVGDISPRTAQRYWDDYLRQWPHQAEWAKQIRERPQAKKTPKR